VGILSVSLLRVFADDGVPSFFYTKPLRSSCMRPITSFVLMPCILFLVPLSSPRNGASRFVFTLSAIGSRPSDFFQPPPHRGDHALAVGFLRCRRRDPGQGRQSYSCSSLGLSERPPILAGQAYRSTLVATPRFSVDPAPVCHFFFFR